MLMFIIIYLTVAQLIIIFFELARGQKKNLNSDIDQTMTFRTSVGLSNHLATASLV